VRNILKLEFETKKGLFGGIEKTGAGTYIVYIHDGRFDRIPPYKFSSSNDKSFIELIKTLKTVK
jgi:hypothetical protein